MTELKDIVDKHFGSEDKDYPTAWAYEQVCKANENKRQRIETLKEVIRKAYTAATTGELVSRAYNVQMILEEVLEVDDG